jgi:hypothetical protein
MRAALLYFLIPDACELEGIIIELLLKTATLCLLSRFVKDGTNLAPSV